MSICPAWSNPEQYNPSYMVLQSSLHPKLMASSFWASALLQDGNREFCCWSTLVGIFWVIETSEDIETSPCTCFFKHLQLWYSSTDGRWGPESVGPRTADFMRCIWKFESLVICNKTPQGFWALGHPITWLLLRKLPEKDLTVLFYAPSWCMFSVEHNGKKSPFSKANLFPG